MNELKRIDYPKLSNDLMDKTHDETFQLIFELQSCPRHELEFRIEQLIKHTKDHFDKERELMIKTSFPAFQEHESEHSRIIADLIRFQGAFLRGRVMFARMFFTSSLPETLIHHIKSIDSALSAHIKLHELTQNDQTFLHVHEA